MNANACWWNNALLGECRSFYSFLVEAKWRFNAVLIETNCCRLPELCSIESVADPRLISVDVSNGVVRLPGVVSTDWMLVCVWEVLGGSFSIGDSRLECSTFVRREIVRLPKRPEAIKSRDSLGVYLIGLLANLLHFGVVIRPLRLDLSLERRSHLGDLSNMFASNTIDLFL